MAILMLRALNVPLVAKDTGLNYGRTVELNCANGEFLIKSVGKPSKIV
jgi:chemotaxis protein CheD